MIAHHVAVWQCQIILVKMLSHFWRRRRQVSGNVVNEICSHRAGEPMELIAQKVRMRITPQVVNVRANLQLHWRGAQRKHFSTRRNRVTSEVNQNVDSSRSDAGRNLQTRWDFFLGWGGKGRRTRMIFHVIMGDAI